MQTTTKETQKNQEDDAEDSSQKSFGMVMAPPQSSHCDLKTPENNEISIKIPPHNCKKSKGVQCYICIRATNNAACRRSRVRRSERSVNLEKKQYKLKRENIELAKTIRELEAEVEEVRRLLKERITAKHYQCG